MQEQTQLTRRRLLAGVGVAGASTASLTLIPGESRAAVELGALDIQGVEKEVDGPPSEALLTVAGDFAIQASTAPEMTQITLQVIYDSTGDDLATDATYDALEGTFSLEADLFEHRAFDAAEVMPSSAGETKTTEILVRVIASVVDNGSLQAENSIETAVPITLTHAGVKVALGASGSLSVN